MNTISFHKLTKRYGSVLAVDDLSFDVLPGRVTGLPAENITPLVRRTTVERYGWWLLAVLDAVSARLSTSTLRGLDWRVELARLPPGDVADDWLRAQALIPPRPGGQ